MGWRPFCWRLTRVTYYPDTRICRVPTLAWSRQRGQASDGREVVDKD
jgi:hypothetical protein